MSSKELQPEQTPQRSHNLQRTRQCLLHRSTLKFVLKLPRPLETRAADATRQWNAVKISSNCKRANIHAEMWAIFLPQASIARILAGKPQA